MVENKPLFPNYFVEISPTGAYIMENSIYSGASALINWCKDNFDRCPNETEQSK